MEQAHYQALAQRWSEGVHSDGSTTRVVDKYSGALLAEVPNVSTGQLDRALDAARSARAPLYALGAEGRSAALHRLADGLEKRKDELATLIQREAGKPIRLARVEVERALLTLRTAAHEALMTAERTPVDLGPQADRSAVQERYPVGVVAAITPFNFPLNLVLHKVAPALAVGCPVVLKPAPQAPLSALALAELVAEVGWPPHSLQVLVCANGVAEGLVRDARAALLSFTGSDAVGWKLKALADKKQVVLELGGNAAAVVAADADLAHAARLLAKSAFGYAGQSCISAQRILVEKAIFPTFRDLFLAEAGSLAWGDPTQEQVWVGPVIDEGHYHRINTWVQQALEEGAELLLGGPGDPAHHLIQPTVLTGTRPHQHVWASEVFGPVAVLEQVEDFADGLERTNQSRYGLQAAVFTQQHALRELAFRTLEVGAVVVNDAPSYRADPMPYGGVKDSGLGREGIRSAMLEMSVPRLLVG